MFYYIVSDCDDILGVYDTLDKAKISCDINGYSRIDQYKLNEPKSIKCWLYNGSRWEEFNL